MLFQIAFTVLLSSIFVENGQASSRGTSWVKPAVLSIDDYIVMEGHPCKIVDMAVRSTTMLKWTRFVGRDVFTNETYEEDVQPHEDVEVPEVTLKEYPVASTGYAHLVLKNEDGNMKSIAVPKIKLWNTIKVHFDFGYNPVVTVVTALGEEKVVSFRSEAPEAFVVIDLVEGDK